MALKGDRNIVETDISFHMDEVATRGVGVVYSTSGSGAALDQGSAVVTVAADPSGLVPKGILLNDMVNKDLTRETINLHKDEVQKGGKVTLLTMGWAVTDDVTGSPTAGDGAFLTAAGALTPTEGPDNTTPRLGRFESEIDEDGFAKVSVNLP